jgi:hypothetical protein
MPKKIIDECVLMRRCSRFDSCNCPQCPLDFKMKKRVRNTEDEYCTMRKFSLKKIAGEFLTKLPWIDTLNKVKTRKAINAPKKTATKNS